MIQQQCYNCTYENRILSITLTAAVKYSQLHYVVTATLHLNEPTRCLNRYLLANVK